MLELPTGPKLWNRTLHRGDVECEISPQAQRAFRSAISTLPREQALGFIPVVESAPSPLVDDINHCRRVLESGPRVAIIRALPDLDASERRLFAWMVANIFGEPLAQNAAGDRVIPVYARPGNRRVIDGARYHQSREGGGPHTDNVSLPEDWEYLVFSCIRPATVGGESILIDGLTVHQELQRMPAALEILERPFWWEYRGISEGLFQAPIVTYDADAHPRFRYLRKYLESAHRRADQPLTDEQVWALDVLEALVERSDLQWRTRLECGEILVTIDSQVFHARTAFADETPGGAATPGEALNGSWRFFDRVWARKRS